MADIDFDELDKAVNDLMANVDTSKRPAGLDDPEDTVLTVPETSTQSTPEAAPVVDTAAEAKAEPEAATDSVAEPATAKPENATSPSLAVKRRGQFMDIVHPSLNMNNTTPKSVSRQGVTLQPSVDGVTAPVTPVTPPAPAPASEEAPADVTTDQPTVESTWPDPIDMATASTDVGESTETVSTEQSVEPTPDPVASEAPADPEPLSSPFLPDAKPEKRPLGGLSDALPATDATPTAPVETPPVAPVVLPEEFSGDLMAVESRDLSSHPDAAKSEVPATPEPAASAVSAPEQQDEVPPASVSSDPQPPAGGSIAQQYTEQPSSGDQTNGSIYDTATYHQAIADAQPVKRKSSPLTFIIWAVVLLLVGATAGAAYFYFTR